MNELVVKYACVVALLGAGILGIWTSAACRRAARRGEPGGDGPFWTGLGLVFVVFALTKLASVSGVLRLLEDWLRVAAKDQGLYADRRKFQIAASLAIVALVAILLTIGIVSMWNYLKRYRLAVAFGSLAFGFGLVRFVSLHEVDAWNTAMPWLRVIVELLAAAGASTIAAIRLRRLKRSETTA